VAATAIHVIIRTVKARRIIVRFQYPLSARRAGGLSTTVRISSARAPGADSV